VRKTLRTAPVPGPFVTYVNPDGGPTMIVVAGVTFEEGIPVNVVEKLGLEKALPVIAKLDAKPQFKVSSDGN
jgi:hypothetical protein